MKRHLVPLWLSCFVVGLAAVTAPAADQDSCADLAKQKYDHVTIVSAVFVNDPQGLSRPRHLACSALPGHKNYGAVLPGRWLYRAGQKFAHRF